MSGHWGILVSDPCLQNQFTQVELRSLKTHVSKIILLTIQFVGYATKFELIQLFQLNPIFFNSMKDWIFYVVIGIGNLGRDHFV